MRRTKTIVKELTLTTPEGKRSMALGKEISFLSALGPGALPRLTAAGDVVFASYGITDPSLNRNDYEGLQLQGKVVVIAGVVPPGLDSAKTKQMENPQALLTGRLRRAEPCDDLTEEGALARACACTTTDRTADWCRCGGRWTSASARPSPGPARRSAPWWSARVVPAGPRTPGWGR
jgi:hypothetical protein